MKQFTVLRYIFVLLAAFLFTAAAAYSQPGDEHVRNRLLADGFKRRIADTTKQIAREPANVSLFEARGDLYVRLYRAVFSNGYGQDDKISAGFTEVGLVSKAIDDYTHVFWSQHGPAELLLKRGSAYALRWYLTTRIDWREATRGNRDPRWNDIVDWQDTARQRAAFDKVVKSPDFDLAVADLDRATRERNFIAVEVAANAALGRLYLERARTIPYAEYEYLRDLGASQSESYSVWHDLDEAIARLCAVETETRAEPMELLAVPLGFGEGRSRNAVFEKVRLAVAIGRDSDAYAFDRNYATWVRAETPHDDLACKFYTMLYALENRLGKHDSVIDYFGVTQEADLRVECDQLHEPRGDAYLAKGEFAKAVADYSIAAKYPWALTSTPRLYVNRAKAYLMLGDKSSALADLNTYLWHISGGYATPEDYLMRAKILRDLGEDKKATEDDRTAADIGRSIKLNADNRKRPGVIYGTVVTPDGKPVARSETSAIELIYADGTAERWTPSLDERGRFVFNSLKPMPFYLYAHSEESAAGVSKRLSARTRQYPITRTHTGPIVITLRAARR